MTLFHLVSQMIGWLIGWLDHNVNLHCHEDEVSLCVHEFLLWKQIKIVGPYTSSTEGLTFL